MNAPLPLVRHRAAIDPGWRAERLAEARGVIADISQHPISLVILACRTIAAHSPDCIECAEAVALWRMLDPRPLHALAAAAFENGGAR